MQLPEAPIKRWKATNKERYKIEIIRLRNKK